MIETFSSSCLTFSWSGCVLWTDRFIGGCRVLFQFLLERHVSDARNNPIKQVILLLRRRSFRAVSFFVVAGVCILAICLIYCRPLLRSCLCGHKCPCGHRSRGNLGAAWPLCLAPTNGIASISVTSANPAATANDNPVYVLNNEGLPDYETISKDPNGPKDTVLPSYAFVAEHPTDFWPGNSRTQRPTSLSVSTSVR